MRKTADVTIPIEGRDKGKLFRLTEMPALQAERWARRALHAISQGGWKLTDQNIEPGTGMAGIFMLPYDALASMQPDMADELFDEMLSTCVKIVRDKSHPDMVFDVMPSTDYEEISTIIYLRGKIIELHTGFFFVEKVRTLISALVEKTNDTSDIQTSRGTSAE